MCDVVWNPDPDIDLVITAWIKFGTADGDIVFLVVLLVSGRYSSMKLAKPFARIAMTTGMEIQSSTRTIDDGYEVAIRMLQRLWGE